MQGRIQGGGVCFNKHDGRPTERRTILQWTNNMGGWSVARLDSPSCLLKQAPGFLKKGESILDLGLQVKTKGGSRKGYNFGPNVKKPTSWTKKGVRIPMDTHTRSAHAMPCKVETPFYIKHCQFKTFPF